MNSPLPLRRLRPRSSSEARAFTLIELLVVIVVLGILMAVAVPTFLKQQVKAQDSKAQQQLDTAYRVAKTTVPEANGNQYPALGSLVSDIRESEPELTVSQGNCSQATSDKTIVFDSAISSLSKVYLYGKSTSGTVWRLTADPFTAPALTPLGSCSGPLTTATLSASGNEVTDTSRRAAVQGDALAPESSYGMWSPSTNLAKNGGFESGVTNLGGHAETSVLDSSRVLFGSRSLKTTCDGSGVCGIYPIYASGGNPGSRVPVSASQPYTGSVFVYVSQDTVFNPLIEWYDGTNTLLSTTGANLQTVRAGQWTRIYASGTAPASAVGATPVFYTQSTTTTQTFWYDGLQFEQQQFPTPYIETNGASQSRAAARIQISAAPLNTTQGWVVIRARMGHNQTTSSSPPLYPCFFWWGDDASHQLRLDYHSVSHAWDFLRWNGSAIGYVSIPATYVSGDTETLIATWTATQIGISVNGSPFTYVANTSIPAAGVMPPTVDIGQYGGTTYLNQRLINSNVLWQAAGNGLLSDQDARTIASWGDRDPTPQDFSVAAVAKETWAADDTTVVSG